VIYDFFNSKQLLKTETKLIFIIHLKALLFKLDNVLLWKYMYIFFSKMLLHRM